MDSCALSAARRNSTAAPTAITRASSAGTDGRQHERGQLPVGQLERPGPDRDADITFRDAAYAATTDPAVAKYAQCQHIQPGVQLWLMQAMSAFSGNAGLPRPPRTWWRSAVATRASAQTTCPIPLALKPKAGGTAPDYGFVGEWVTLIMAQGAPPAARSAGPTWTAPTMPPKRWPK